MPPPYPSTHGTYSHQSRPTCRRVTKSRLAMVNTSATGLSSGTSVFLRNKTASAIEDRCLDKPQMIRAEKRRVTPVAYFQNTSNRRQCGRLSRAHGDEDACHRRALHEIDDAGCGARPPSSFSENISVMVACVASGPTIPRCIGTQPVALAAQVISNIVFEPSTYDAVW